MIKKIGSLALLLSAISLARAAPPEQTLSMGIVPQQSVSRLAEEWGPLLAEVGRRAGVTLVFRTAPGIPVFEERLAQGDYDLAYMNPYHYVVFHKANGYQAFAREQNRKIRGILVVKKASSYHQLADLKGRTVVFPAPAAFAASILPQAEFGRLHIPVEAKFVASHDSVYRAVAAGNLRLPAHSVRNKGLYPACLRRPSPRERRGVSPRASGNDFIRFRRNRTTPAGSAGIQGDLRSSGQGVE